MHWSLRPGTKHLQTDPKGLHYSTDPAAYEPRCSYCHVWRDKYLRTGRGPVLVEIAGLILQAVEEAAGGSPPARSTGSPRRTASTSGR